MDQEIFNQLQYLINKYFFVIILVQIFLFLSPFILIKINSRILKFIPYLILPFFSIIYYIKVFRNIYLIEGWDRYSICSWIDIAENYENLNIYTVQMQRTLNFDTPMFSLYYHPILLNKFEFFCNLSIEIYNFLILGLITTVTFIFMSYFKQINKSSIIIIVFFAFNNILWLLITGQFFFLEISTLILSLLFLRNKNFKLSILFMFVFGIQKIYLLIFSLYLAFKYFKAKGIAGILVLVVTINLLTIKILPDFINFWFSSEGYLFGDRGSSHSFLQESFGPNNQSLFFLIKDILIIFTESINSLVLIFIVLTLSIVFVYKLYKRLEPFVSSLILDLIVLLGLLLTYPLLKPYSFIYYSIILLFLLEEINSSNLESVAIQLTSLTALPYMYLSDFLFVRPEESSYILFLQYKFLMSYNFFSSWVLFIFIYKLVSKKKNESI